MMRSTAVAIAWLLASSGASDRSAPSKSPTDPGRRKPVCEWEHPGAAGLPLRAVPSDITAKLGSAPIKEDGTDWSICYEHVARDGTRTSLTFIGSVLVPAIIRIRRESAPLPGCGRLKSAPSFSNGLRAGLSADEVTARLGAPHEVAGATWRTWRYECERRRPLTASEALQANEGSYVDRVTTLSSWRMLAIELEESSVTSIELVEADSFL